MGKHDDDVTHCDMFDLLLANQDNFWISDKKPFQCEKLYNTCFYVCIFATLLARAIFPDRYSAH